MSDYVFLEGFAGEGDPFLRDPVPNRGRHTSGEGLPILFDPTGQRGLGLRSRRMGSTVQVDHVNGPVPLPFDSLNPWEVDRFSPTVMSGSARAVPRGRVGLIPGWYRSPDGSFSGAGDEGGFRPTPLPIHRKRRPIDYDGHPPTPLPIHKKRHHGPMGWRPHHVHQRPMPVVRFVDRPNDWHRNNGDVPSMYPNPFQPLQWGNRVWADLGESPSATAFDMLTTLPTLQEIPGVKDWYINGRFNEIVNRGDTYANDLIDTETAWSSDMVRFRDWLGTTLNIGVSLATAEDLAYRIGINHTESGKQMPIRLRINYINNSPEHGNGWYQHTGSVDSVINYVAGHRGGLDSANISYAAAVMLANWTADPKGGIQSIDDAVTWRNAPKWLAGKAQEAKAAALSLARLEREALSIQEEQDPYLKRGMRPLGMVQKDIEDFKAKYRNPPPAAKVVGFKIPNPIEETPGDFHPLDLFMRTAPTRKELRDTPGGEINQMPSGQVRMADGSFAYIPIAAPGGNLPPGAMDRLERIEAPPRGLTPMPVRLTPMPSPYHPPPADVLLIPPSPAVNTTPTPTPMGMPQGAPAPAPMRMPMVRVQPLPSPDATEEGSGGSDSGGGVMAWFQQSSIIPGVKNMYLAAGAGGLVLLLLMFKGGGNSKD